MRRLRGARGQTTTEFAMIVGLTVVIATGMVVVMSPTVRETLQQATECVISDVCSASKPHFALRAASVLPSPDTVWGLFFHLTGRRQDVANALDLVSSPFEYLAGARDKFDCDVLGRSDLCDGQVLSDPEPKCAVSDTIFVNGIVTTFADMKDECSSLGGAVANTRVTCIYNLSDGMPLDLGESADIISDVDSAVTTGRSYYRSNPSIQAVKNQIKAKLRPVNVSGEPLPSSEPVELVGHSEGAAILSLALWQLYQDNELSDSEWHRLSVSILGGAERRFPPKLRPIVSIENVNDSGQAGDRLVATFVGRDNSKLDCGSVACISAYEVPTECRDSIDCHAASRYLPEYADTRDDTRSIQYRESGDTWAAAENVCPRE